MAFRLQENPTMWVQIRITAIGAAFLAGTAAVAYGQDGMTASSVILGAMPAGQSDPPREICREGKEGRRQMLAWAEADHRQLLSQI
jgi:hypothetical protein